MDTTTLTSSDTSGVNVTTLESLLNTTTSQISSTNKSIFDPDELYDAWNTHKTTLAWLIPVIIIIIIILAIFSLGLFYAIRGVEIWVLKCCYRNCCARSSRRLENEFTHLTDGLHDHDAMTLTEFDKSDRSGHTRKQD